MKQPIPLLAVLLTLWIGGGAWMYYNASCCTGAAAETYSSPLLIKDVSNTIASHPENFIFGLANNVPQIPGRIEASFSEVAKYLNEHPEKSLLLTGYYRADEANPTSFENLGLARADTIKDYLLGLGFSEERILLKGQLNDQLVDVNQEIYGGITYGFETKEVAAPSPPPPPKQLMAGPLTLYFGKNNQDLLLDTSQTAYFDNLIRYLAQNPSVIVGVEGHTDADGDEKLNTRLGRKRAEFVRDYMIELGIASNQIRLSHKGPDEPIASNETREGKAKNRRVEVSLIK